MRRGRAIARKRSTLYLLAIAELLGMAVWFSASAVAPQLAQRWSLGAGGRAWLTISVQLGFVAGALVSAILNLSDRWATHKLFAGSAVAAAMATSSIPLFNAGFGEAVFLRFLTGFFLVGVYPVGMKIMATWTKEDRGWGIGLLVGALTMGSAFPHLLRAVGKADDWRMLLYQSSSAVAIGGIIAAIAIREGPYRTAAPPFHWQFIGEVLKQRDVLLANLGYLGHMWELYAMWAWAPAFLAASFKISGIDASWASAAAFAVIAAGGFGSLLAGKLADQWGRTIVINVSLVTSGLCCLAVGFLFGGSPLLMVVLMLIWGFAVVADSAQFSACVTELCQREYMGTAVTLQTCLGFLLTTITLRMIPALESRVGWRWAFAVLALGPLLGVWAIATLRRQPSAVRLAGGKR